MSLDRQFVFERDLLREFKRLGARRSESSCLPVANTAVDVQEAERDRLRPDPERATDGDLLHDFEDERRFEFGEREPSRDRSTECGDAG